MALSFNVAAQTPSTLKGLSLEQLMDVEVTSVSRRPERLFETASAIQVITQEDIHRFGATSIPEALRLASNLEVAQIDARQWAISSRGFNSTTANKMLVLIDGRTIYTPLYAGVFWDVQDTLLEDIDRIEVISGPGATVWGSNAVNGVINIITKKAKDTQGFLLSGGGGTELNGFGGIRYGGAIGRTVHYRMYGKSFDRESAVFANGANARDDWRMSQFGFRGEWDASSSDLFTVQGDLYTGRAGQLMASDIGLGGGNVLGRWSHTLSENSDLRVQFYYDRTNRRIPGTFSEGLDTYDVDLQHRFPLGERHDVVWGVGYRLIDDHILNSDVLGFLPPDVSRQWLSAFVQDELALIKDRLHLTVGTKLEHNDYTGIEVQPTGRLVWKLTSQQTVWGAVSRAVRTPSRIDREFFIRAPGVNLTGGSDFSSEDLLAYELGYRTEFHNRISLSVASFYNDYDNLRSLERTNPPQPSPLVVGNGLKGKSYGTEFVAEYRARESWHLRGSYSPLQIHFRHRPGSTDLNPGTVEAQDSTQQFSLRSSLDLPKHLQVDHAFRYVNRIASQNVPGYGELDGQLAWRPVSKLEFSIIGQNLLHRRHPEFGTLPNRREIQRSVGLKFLWLF